MPREAQRAGSFPRNFTEEFSLSKKVFPRGFGGGVSLCYDVRPMRVVEKNQLMSATEIDRTLQRLAHEIVEKSGGTANLALIGIRRRGVPLAQRIAHAMRGIDGVEVPVGTLDITLYRDDLSKVAPQPVLHSSEIPFPRGR